MICVSIGRGRHRHVIAEYRHLVDQGAKLVELRLDYISGEVNLKRLVADRPCPVVITCRRVADGGKFTGTEDQRMLLLRTAIAEGVEYVDLEEDIASSIPRFGRTKRIISLHDFRKTPDDLDEIHGRLCGLDPDIIKICTMANHPHDNLRILELSRRSKAADDRPVHGRYRHSLADSGRQVRLAVHFRDVPSRAGIGPRSAQFPANDRDLPLRRDQRRYRGVRGDRRPDRPQSQSADPQRGVPTLQAEQSLHPHPRAA